MNSGKRFEQNFRKSVPDSIYVYKLRDGTASWGGSTTTRFQLRNICDYLVYRADIGLFLFELKSCASASLPFSNIRDGQIKDMLEASEYSGVYPYFIVNLRKHEKTFGLHVKDAYNYMRIADRKSYPLELFEEKGIGVPQRKLRVNYRYDIIGLLEKIKKEKNE